MQLVSNFRVRVLAGACAVVLLLGGAGAFGGTIYVEEGASGAGSSWADAYGDLQDALDDAGSGDEIWVAEGTYKPSVEVGGTGDRYRTFQMKNNVAVYGGFDGTETALEERDAQNNETILSGDIGVPSEPNDNDCYHVFYHPDGTNLNASAVLDGFTITAGNADGSGAHDDGGGMFNYNSSSPTVTNCTFSGNSANYYGGGMYNRNSSSPTLTNCTFSGNSADHDGGGMYNRESNPTVTNCIFTGNSADEGGGMFNYSSSPTVTNCIFWGNTAASANNEIHNYGSSIPAISYCDIQGGCSGTGNIDVNPDFVDLAGGDFHLQGGSPCVDTGDNRAPSLGATDFEGDPRIMNGIVDMGVYEVDGDLLFLLDVSIQPFVRACTLTLDPAGRVYLYPYPLSRQKTGSFKVDLSPLVKAVGTEGARRATGVPTATPYTSAGV